MAVVFLDTNGACTWLIGAPVMGAPSLLGNNATDLPDWAQMASIVTCEAILLASSPHFTVVGSCSELFCGCVQFLSGKNLDPSKLSPDPDGLPRPTFALIHHASRFAIGQSERLRTRETSLRSGDLVAHFKGNSMSLYRVFLWPIDEKWAVPKRVRFVLKGQD